MTRLLLAFLSCLGLCAPQVRGENAAGNPQQWLKALESPEFTVRERAVDELAAWAKERPDEARGLFLDRFLTHDDPEVRMRCRELLRELVLAAEYRGVGRGFVGILPADIPIVGGGFGVRVAMVQPNTPAAKVGLRVGDVIESLDGRRWNAPGAMDRFRAEVMSRRPGAKVVLSVRRPGGKQPIDVELELGERPAEPEIVWPQLRIDPEIQRRQLEEMKQQEEEAFFERWLERQLERHRERLPGAAPR